MTKNYSITNRLRRNRKAVWIRDLIAETVILPSNLILPLFVIEGKNKEEKISSMPGVSRLSIDLVVKKLKEAQKLGINSCMLFPVVDQKLKSENGKEALNKNNLICRAISEIKNHIPDFGVICDVALDPYTTSGHDGIVDKNGYVLNDETVEILCRQALLQAAAGCDSVAPSDMMDGRVGEIRKSLDGSGFVNISIISYSAKYASNFYSPFRDAVGSASNLKKSDKKTYQMDFRNRNEAMRKIEVDISEGADAIIVKPAMSYLDVILDASQNFNIPIFAYQVSGEYAMLKCAAQNGFADFDKIFHESLISIKRAGANAIITYGAIEFVKNNF